MKKEILDFINENALSPFEDKKTIRQNYNLFKTNDAKAVHTKLLTKIFQSFEFTNTENLFSLLSFTEDINEIEKRKDFFSNLVKRKRDFLIKLIRPKQFWKPRYEVVVVTENEETFIELKKLDCPVQFVTSEQDLASLENCEVVQVIDCENYSPLLETLPQTVFLNSIEEVYLERYLSLLSGWKDNLEILEKEEFDEEGKEIVKELFPLLSLIQEEKRKKLTKRDIDEKINEINEKIQEKIKNMTLSGASIFEIVSKNKIPKEIEELTKQAILESKLPSYLFNVSIPVSLDEREVEKFLKKQDAEEFTSSSEIIKRNARLLIQIPEKLKRLEYLLLYFDFISGLFEFFEKNDLKNMIENSEELFIENSKNVFLDKAQPISFNLTREFRCSVLTGANSGGKTTLLEHILQIISLMNFGFPCSGKVNIPVFSEVYYFAKNKGSANKGAFETLLTQMSQIWTGKRTLILADEIESVTEPGVAGQIISATCNYFVKKNCFLVIATHLGQEIQKRLPASTRIDGIEAKGLNENFDLIVDHNPVLGRLANSTPELIVEKMANSQKLDYFIYLNDYLKGKII